MASSAASDAVGLGQAMIVAGIGCRKGASAADISAAIEDALNRAGLAAQALDLVAAPEFKGGEQGVASAAAANPTRRESGSGRAGCAAHFCR